MTEHPSAVTIPTLPLVKVRIIAGVRHTVKRGILSMHELAVIEGCGHVALPLGMVFADNGYRVTLIDDDPGRTAPVREGKLPFQEKRAEPLRQRARENGGVEVREDLKALTGEPRRRDPLGGEADRAGENLR